MGQWEQVSTRLNEWGSPLRPSEEDVALYEEAVGEGGRVLLLGVTKELLPLANVAIDHDPKVIEIHKTSAAVLGDWGDLPFEAQFDTVIGDGCLTVFQGKAEKLFAEVKKALKPGGRLILRVFIAPDERESLESVFSLKGQIGFHAFKWRVAHALANPYVPVEEIAGAIRPIWNHPTLEVYQGSNWVYYFPRLKELPPWERVLWPTSYELADRCPVVVWRFH